MDKDKIYYDQIMVTHLEEHGPLLKLFIQFDITIADEIKNTLKRVKPSFAPINSDDVAVSKLVLTKYNTEFFRARVTGRKQDSQITLRFIDYGYSKDIIISNISDLKGFTLMGVPEQAKECISADITLNNRDPNTKDRVVNAFKRTTLMKPYISCEIVEDGDVPKVKLYFKGISVEKILKENGYAEFTFKEKSFDYQKHSQFKLPGEGNAQILDFERNSTYSDTLSLKKSGTNVSDFPETNAARFLPSFDIKRYQSLRQKGSTSSMTGVQDVVHFPGSYRELAMNSDIEYLATICHLETDTDTFYIQLRETKYQRQNILQTVEGLGPETFIGHLEVVKPGNPCLVKGVKPGTYDRGLIKGCYGSFHEVQLVDIGSVKLVTHADLYLLPPVLLKWEIQAIRCSVEDKYLPNINLLKTLKANARLEFRVVRRKHDLYVVGLFRNTVDLMGVLRWLRVENWSEETDLRSSIMAIPFPKIRDVERLIFRRAKFDGIFYCQLATPDMKAKLAEMVSKLDVFYTVCSVKNVEPLIGDYVCVISAFDERHYRGEVLNVMGNEAEVFFLDSARLEHVAFSKIFALQPAFTSTPRFSIECVLLNDIFNCYINEVTTEVLSLLEVEVQILGVVEGIYQTNLTENEINGNLKLLLSRFKSRNATVHKPLLNDIPERPNDFTKRRVPFSKERSLMMKFSKESEISREPSHIEIDKTVLVERYDGSNKRYESEHESKKNSERKNESNDIVALVDHLELRDTDASKSQFLKDGLPEFQESQISGPAFALKSVFNFSIEESTSIGIKTDELSFPSRPVPAVLYNSNISKLSPSSSSNSNQMVADMKVLVTHIISPIELYVQPLNKKNELKLLMDDLQCHYAVYAEPNTPFDFQKGSTCAFKTSVDSIWYRGIVHEVLENRVVVQFTDFGRFQLLSKSSIKPLDTSFQLILPQVIKLTLISQKEWSQSDVQELNLKYLLKEVNVTDLSFKGESYKISRV